MEEARLETLAKRHFGPFTALISPTENMVMRCLVNVNERCG